MLRPEGYVPGTYAWPGEPDINIDLHGVRVCSVTVFENELMVDLFADVGLINEVDEVLDFEWSMMYGMNREAWLTVPSVERAVEWVADELNEIRETGAVVRYVSAPGRVSSFIRISESSGRPYLIPGPMGERMIRTDG